MNYALVFVLVSTCTALPTVQHSKIGAGDVAGNGVLISPFMNIGDGVNGAVADVFRSKAVKPSFPDAGKKYAVFEQKGLETFPIQLDNKYGQLQHFAADLYHPKPIVDTTLEHLKYGNDGGKQKLVANAVVNGYEAFANVLNAAVDLPFTVIKELGKKVTTSLNTVGGKLVGLS